MSRGTGTMKGRRGNRKPTKKEVLEEQSMIIFQQNMIIQEQKRVIENLTNTSNINK